MSYICEICKDDPTSHSLQNIGMLHDIVYYYTCPSKATKYYDTVGIVDHYDGVLSKNNHSWVWIFDCNGLNLKHLLEINVGIQLASLISTKFSHNLLKIIIINPTWHIKVILHLVSPFLNNHMKSIITIM